MYKTTGIKILHPRVFYGGGIRMTRLKRLGKGGINGQIRCELSHKKRCHIEVNAMILIIFVN
ncbi:hypothetical protein XSR1_270041 [Xenorhabdus szentirmaii DSM 16338]|uniref:Uncharacterized protein n=1 Tax=Xenorhabdus szentirmaii DSM 16338 TaxID=1427518 RepID=W1IZG8_9GAMM|nr:hypothetical protein XSR1_270041 [Xenorhabdus szentirmaii DSM 16338]